MARLADFGALAIITWHDTFSDENGWLLLDELGKHPAVVHSVGWIVPTADGGNPDHITLYQTRIEDTDQVDSVVHIPIGMVVKVKLLNQ